MPRRAFQRKIGYELAAGASEVHLNKFTQAGSVPASLSIRACSSNAKAALFCTPQFVVTWEGGL